MADKRIRKYKNRVGFYKGDALTGRFWTITPPAFDPDAQAFFTATGITDPTQQDAVNTLVIDLKNEGLWTKMQAIYPFVGGTATTHKYNLKDPRDLNAAFRLEYRGSDITHDANGITFAETSYAVPFVLTGTGVLDRCIGHYVRNVNFTGWDGLFAGISLVHGWKMNNTKIVSIGLNNLIGTDLNHTLGLISASIISSTEAVLVNRTTTLYTESNPSSTQPAYGMPYMDTLNTGTDETGAPWNEPGRRNLALSYYGNGLTVAELIDLNAIVETYQTALGRNI
jgi:hypothetical protein